MNYAGMTITLVILGFGAILWSYYKEDKNMPQIIKKDSKEDYYEEYGARIDELNNKIREMNEYGEFMKSELDKKHKELLFLYQMINEKSKDINCSSEVFEIVQKDSGVDNQIQEQVSPTQEPYEEGDQLRKINHNQMILEFSEKGYSIKEIAQMLDIGQGEVKLVLDLYE